LTRFHISNKEEATNLQRTLFSW